MTVYCIETGAIDINYSRVKLELRKLGPFSFLVKAGPLCNIARWRHHNNQKTYVDFLDFQFPRYSFKLFSARQLRLYEIFYFFLAERSTAYKFTQSINIHRL